MCKRHSKASCKSRRSRQNSRGRRHYSKQKFNKGRILPEQWVLVEFLVQTIVFFVPLTREIKRLPKLALNNIFCMAQLASAICGEHTLALKTYRGVQF